MSNLSAFECAKIIIAHGGGNISNLSLQKALYLAQMLWLGNNDEPLFTDAFEAWDYGPVVKPVYHKFKIYGSSPIRLVGKHSVDSSDIGEHLRDISEFAAREEPFRLVELTHKPGGAWDKVYKPGKSNTVIPLQLIKEEYDQFYSN